MKRKAFLGLVLCCLLSGAARAEDPVYFADATLKALVEDELNVTDPTPTDMRALTSLSVGQEGLTSLTGLETATNLYLLSVWGNEITDLSPLAGLVKLQQLTAMNNLITSVEPLAGLTGLRSLTIRYNDITDVTPLAGLPNLKSLLIEYNAISDARPLVQLPNLTELYIGSNPIADISSFSGFAKLTKLDISRIPIGSLAGLSGLSTLTSLNVMSCELTSLSPLTSLPNLRSLNAYGNDISDLSPLAGLTGLTSLWIPLNHISDISVLASLTQLKDVSLASNSIANIGPLTGLMNLETLQLGGNPLNEDAYCIHLPLIQDNNPSLIPGDNLSYSANTYPPSNVSASKGAYTDKVVITWDGVCDAMNTPYYSVYRSESIDGDKKCITGYLHKWRSATSFEDEHASAGMTYYYWVMSNTANSSGNYYYYSDYSLCDTGWCGSGVATYSLSTSSMSGGSVTTPGEGTYRYGAGSSVSVVGTAQDGYAFSGWTGTAVNAGKVANTSATSTTVTMDADYTLVANFTAVTETHSLSISSGAGGSVTVPGEGTYRYGDGSSVSVVATAQEGYAFSGWSGTAVSAGQVTNTAAASTTVTMDADYTLVANFMEAGETYTLSVSSSAGGSVTTPGEGAFSYEADTVVTVQAVATSDYAFSGWTGTAVGAGKVANTSAAFTTVTMDADYTLMANFTGQTHTLEVVSTAGGWVTSPGEGTFSYSHGQSVLLEAQAEPGYHFTGWSGSLCATRNPLSVEMDASYQVSANFAPNPPVLTVTSGEGGRVVVPGEGAFTYESGSAVRAVAVPEAGYVLAGWTGTPVEAGSVGDPSAARVDFVLEADGTLNAGFVQAARCLYVDVTVAGDAGSDGTWEHPFASIQEAIDAAEIGDTILVLPGTYNEHLDFAGKDIMVSAFDLCTAGAVSKTILAGTDANSVVVFEAGESAGAILAGFTIQGGDAELGGGIRCCGADPVIVNCLIVGNRAQQGGGVYCLASAATLVNCTIADNFAWSEGGGLYCDSDVTVINSILYGNEPEQVVSDPCQVAGVTYSDVQGGWAGVGNIPANPRFAEPGYWMLPSDSAVSVAPDDPAATWRAGDYHLKATEGRWNGWSWLCDGSTSPCVDAGSPEADVRCEPAPHGDRINMGAFGGTGEASQSPAGQ